MCTIVNVRYAISSIPCASYIYSIQHVLCIYSKLSLRWGEREKTQTKEVCLKSPNYSSCSDPEPKRPGLLCFTRKLTGRCNQARRHFLTHTHRHTHTSCPFYKSFFFFFQKRNETKNELTDLQLDSELTGIFQEKQKNSLKTWCHVSGHEVSFGSMYICEMINFIKVNTDFISPMSNQKRCGECHKSTSSH